MAAEKLKLSQIFDLQMGKTPSRNNDLYWDGNNPWISISDIGNANKYIDSTKECITDLGVSESGIKIVPEGTVIMSFKLSIGKTAITAKDMYTNEAIMAFVDKGIYELDKDYIYHLFCSKDWSLGTNKAVMGLTLNKATLSDVYISLPEISIQHSIAKKLDYLDTIIEKRHIQLQKLDDLVKSRFVEMFGDSVKNPHKYNVSSIFDFSKEIFAGGDKPIDISDDLVGDYLYPVYANGEVNLGLQGYAKTYRVRETALTVSARGTIGFCCIRQPFFTPAVRLITIIPKESVNETYLRYAIELIKWKSSGTSQAQLTVPMLKTIKIIYPPTELQNKFATFVEQVDKSKSGIQKSLEKLELLKKSLMQKYLERAEG